MSCLFLFFLRAGGFMSLASTNGGTVKMGRMRGLSEAGKYGLLLSFDRGQNAVKMRGRIGKFNHGWHGFHGSGITRKN